jgi:predicted RNA-binding Zn ribbon-like protein
VEPFARVGNNLSADFVNTAVSFDHAGGTLRSAGDVVDFLETTGTLEKEEARRVRAQLTTSAAAARFLSSALELRTAALAAFGAIEGHEPLADDSLAVINARLAAGAGFERLVVYGGAYRLERQHLRDKPSIALVPIARDVARLLATPDCPVRKCAGEDCVRHFYDDSRTGRRRWCEMAICGNRAKAAAFEKRKRIART